MSKTGAMEGIRGLFYCDINESFLERRMEMEKECKCPVTGRTSKPVAGSGPSNRDWWPNQLNLKILHQHSSLSNPMQLDRGC